MEKRRNLKYILALMLILIGILAFPTTASAAETVGSGTFGTDGDNLTWTLDSDGVLTISGTGEMNHYSWSYNLPPWIKAANGTDVLKKVIIEEGVTSIGQYAFYDEKNLTSVELADSITTIGSHAFSSCDGLTKIDFPANLQTIESYAFFNCYGLTRVELPASLTTLYDSAFHDCMNLKTAIFLNPDTKLDGSPFLYCYDVTIYAAKKGKVKTYAENERIPFKLFTDMNITDFYLGKSLGTSYATLTWKAVELTDGYRIYKYNTSTKKYELKKTVAADKTSYKLTGLKSGTVYRYKICSFVKIDGKTYTSASSAVKFRTKSSSSAISAKNNKISDGYTATIKTISKKYSGLEACTLSYYGNYAAGTSDLSQFKDNKGNFCVAYANAKNTYVFIRAYNKSMGQVYSRKIKMLYPLLGTVTCDDDGNFYIVWGKRDSDNNTGTVTMAISKYKKDGTLVKSYKYKSDSNGSTKEPFRSGNCDIAIYDGILVCSFARGMYNGHQSNGILTIDTATMKKLDTYYNYVSHSFDQRVLFDKYGIAWFVNHGDAYPRAFGVATNSDARVTTYEPFHFYAPESALEDMYVLNTTKARLGGVIETSSGLVLVGSSVKSMQKSGYKSQTKNLFIMYADPDKTMLDGKSRSGICLGEKITDTGVKWLTSYTSYDAENPQVVYTDDDRIVILWEKAKGNAYKNTYYMILSSNGKVLQKATKIKNVRLNADEEPIYKDGYIYWSTCTGENIGTNKLKIHRLNLNTLTFDKSTLAVKKLKVSSKTKTSVTLKWNKVSNATGYYVYRYNTSTKKYTKLTSVKASKLNYTVKKLKSKTNYTFAVRAYKKVNSTTYLGAYTKVKVKTK